MSRDRLDVERPEDLDPAGVRRVAAGAGIRLDDDLLAQVRTSRERAVRALEAGVPAYGVTSGMGALADRVLTPQEQAGHSVRLMAARAVGSAPWLEPAEARAVVAVRLRTLLAPEAAVSAELCERLAALLDDDDPLPPVPRTGAGSAGEIIPLAHAWADLAAGGLGVKEGIALLAGVPVATALALLRSEEVRALERRALAVAAGSVAVAGVPHDPFHPALARGDAEHAAVLADLAPLLGQPPAAPRHRQAPISLRVLGPVGAHVRRAAGALEAAAERALDGVTDSPALLDTGDGPAFLGTAGFHGVDLAGALEALRQAVVHAAAVGASRLHRLLDADVTGLPPQLSADPGPEAGLTPLHKRAVAEVQAVAAAPVLLPVETSGGQEDVQSFALEAAERLRAAIAAWRVVVACELLAVHQARLLGGATPPALDALLASAAAVLPEGAHDRPRGPDVDALVRLLDFSRSGCDGPEDDLVSAS